MIGPGQAEALYERNVLWRMGRLVPALAAAGMTGQEWQLITPADGREQVVKESPDHFVGSIVAVGGMGVLLGRAVAVGGIGVLDGTSVAVGGIGVLLGCGVAVAGIWLAVALMVQDGVNVAVTGIGVWLAD